MHKRFGSGFTIVELLVVIVVIAILSAIVIVSYNGITSRAKNVEIISRVDAYTKMVQLYKIENGQYPTVPSTETGLPGQGCLGDAADFPADATYPAGACYKTTVTSPASSLSITTSPTLMSQLRTVSSGPSTGAIPTVFFTIPNGTNDIRGFLYSGGGAESRITYMLKGDQECGRGTKNTGPEYGNNTICVVVMQ